MKIRWGIYTSWQHFKFNIMNEILHFLKFQEFTNELAKIYFQLGKTELG